MQRDPSASHRRHNDIWNFLQVVGSKKCMAAGPISRILSAGLLRQDGHSSGPRITAWLKRPTRRFGAPSRHAPGRSLRSEARLPPYLVLLRVGFALPAALLQRRCALTAPFHPYLSLAARAVYFLWHFPSTELEPSLPDVIRHTALRSSDFPLSYDSGRPIRLPTGSLYAIVAALQAAGRTGGVILLC